ncbi:hypothetical protein PHLGIDRAFT_62530, partial [Phlebiopsis gigantea 11061_1 CR5-6]
MPGPKLSDLDDDTLIHVFGFLEVKDILRMRGVGLTACPKTSNRIATISRTRVVWTRALISHVLNEGLPFPPVCVDTTPMPALEELVIRALQLTEFWTHPSRTTSPQLLAEFSASSGTGVSEVRFIPAHPSWVVTVTRGIWPLITCWDFTAPVRAATVAMWTRQGALITDIAVNSDPDGEACLAVSLSYARHHCIEILAIRPLEQDSKPIFVSLASVETTFRAMSLQGDILAASDDMNETHIINWKTNESAILCGSDEPSEHNFQASSVAHHNRCLQVLFSQKCVFVVRARSFEAFPVPPLLPHKNVSEPYHSLACHRFGWLDGVAVTEQKQLSNTADSSSPISILLRAESDDPWSSDVHTLDLYELAAQPGHTDAARAPEDRAADAPYRFPPRHAAASSTTRCTTPSSTRRSSSPSTRPSTTAPSPSRPTSSPRCPPAQRTASARP